MPGVMQTACSMAAWELTNPLNFTTPLKVSTLTSRAFTDGSFTSAAFTFVVIQVSLRYSPVLSLVGLPAHPRMDTNTAARKTTDKRLRLVMTHFSSLSCDAPFSRRPKRRSVRSRTYPLERLD